MSVATATPNDGELARLSGIPRACYLTARPFFCFIAAWLDICIWPRLRACWKAGCSQAELVTLQRVRVEPGYALPGPLKPSLGARALAIPGQRGPSRAYPGSTLAVDSEFGVCINFLEEQNRQLASSLSTGLRVTVLGGRERFSGLFEAGCRNQAPRDGFTACPENLYRSPRAITTKPKQHGTHHKQTSPLTRDEPKKYPAQTTARLFVPLSGSVGRIAV